MSTLPYCGTPPSPGELLSRFNFDSLLIATLLVFALALIKISREPSARALVLAGWSVAAAAFVSPLCALSVSLFSARIAQHMILLLVASPLIALGLPHRSRTSSARALWAWGALFFASLWFWHFPAPYEATFKSTPIYWSMHITLFGTALALWRELLHHATERTADALIVGTLTSLQMSVLGAVLTFSGTPLFYPHLLTSAAWGLTPLQDQQLGGVLMWVPGMALFLWAAVRSWLRLWDALEGTSTR